MADEANSIKKLMAVAAIMLVLTTGVLMGIAVVDGFSKQLRTPTTIALDEYTLPANNTVTRIGTSGQYPFAQSLTGCINSTNGNIALPTANYTITEGTELGGYIFIVNGTRLQSDVVNCTFKYLADSVSQANADKWSVGLAIFAAFAAILALGAVGKVIVEVFKKS